MLIAVAGPYSAETPEQRQRNLDAMNEAAADVMKLGHIPVIGVNAALPVVACLGPDANKYEALMAISIALVEKCDAILMIGHSAGVDRELAVIEAKGLPVYCDVRDIPAPSSLPVAT
ncbi:MAG TPA: DUF4406 domain-containing protein [Pyrinomonadaceae bacterium]|nr:DUF4406 domain-containing protein [Pyrinomonadaceae bacterium]